MKAIVLEQFGGVEKLLVKDVPTPGIKSGEVLIKAKAFSVNPVDYKTREGKGAAKRLTLPIILGWDVCGEVVELSNNSKFKVGDIVFGLVNFPGEGKTYAEYVVAPAEHVVKKPANISEVEAAAIPLVALTAYQTLIKEGKINQDSRVLIQSASGGVGHVAVQIAKSVRAYVVAVASGKNRDFVLSLGADEFIDYEKENFADIVKDIDVVLDCVGGETALKLVSVIKDGGKLISLPASPFDDKPNTINPTVETPFMLVHSSQEDMQIISNLMQSEKLKVHIHQTFPFNQIKEAHQLLEFGGVRGKMVVLV